MAPFYSRLETGGGGGCPGPPEVLGVCLHDILTYSSSPFIFRVFPRKWKAYELWFTSLSVLNHEKEGVGKQDIAPPTRNVPFLKLFYLLETSMASAMLTLQPVSRE